MKILKTIHNKWLLVIVWMSMGIYGVINIILAFLLMNIVDAVTGNQRELFMKMVIAAGMLVLFEFVINIASKFLLNLFCTKEVIHQKTLQFQKFIYITNDTIPNVSAFSAEIDLLYNDYYTNLARIAYDIIQLILATISIVYLSWKVAGVVLISIILPFLIPALFQKPLQHSTESYQTSSGSYLAFVQDSLQGLEEIRTYHAFSFFSAGHDNLNCETERKRLINKLWLAFNNASASLVSTLSFVVILIFCGYLCLVGESTLGLLIAVIQLMNSIVGPISMLSGEFGGIQSAKKLVLPDEEFFSDQKTAISEHIHALTAKNLEFSYDEKHCVLQNVNLRLERGKCYAIVGESGVGKSTLAKLLSGRLEASCGEIQLLDENGNQIHERLMDHVQYVAQEPYVFNLSPKENVYFGQTEQIDDWQTMMDHLLIGQFANNKKRILSNRDGISGGQKQRLVIARALSHPIDILILDEPTANIDQDAALKVMRYILESQEGIAVVITHDTRSEILSLFDQVIYLK